MVERSKAGAAKITVKDFDDPEARAMHDVDLDLSDSARALIRNGAFADGATRLDCRRAVKPHGLRKAACRRLAEAGCSGNEIMSISGHATLKELVRYTKAADQKRLAQAALARTMAAQKGVA